MTEVRLRPPQESDEAAVRAAHEALHAEGFEFALGLEHGMSWRGWLRLIALEHAGIGLPTDRVPATFLIAEVGDAVAGRVSIRHQLNQWLWQHGGHIGYGVVPAMRRRGLATDMLRQSLIVARALGVSRALLTCDDNNAASIRVIESCGGWLDPQQPHSSGEPLMRRYWIE